MFALVMTWIGLVLGMGTMMLMAFGPAIVELDGWLATRKRAKADSRAAARQARAGQQRTAGRRQLPVAGPVALG